MIKEVLYSVYVCDICKTESTQPNDFYPESWIEVTWIEETECGNLEHTKNICADCTNSIVLKYCLKHITQEVNS